MKILHYVPSFLNGGIETMLVNVANMQAADGNTVAVMVFTDRVSPDLVAKLSKSVKLYCVGKPVGNHNPLYVLKANRFHKSFAPDVFHFHATEASRLFPFKNRSERRVATIHSNSLPVSAHPSVDRYIAISRCVQEYFRGETGKDSVLCYNGIDIASFSVKNEYKDRPSKILSIGRLTPVKGIDILIKGFAGISREFPDLSLDIWGEGEQRRELEELIDSLSLQDRIMLCGNVDTRYVEKHIADYDIVIQSSRHEGLGISAIEAMAAGVPLIVSGADGFLEVTDNGRLATLFEKENPVALGDSIRQVIEEYRNVAAIAREAETYVAETFSLRVLVDNLYRIYIDC